MDNFIPTLLIVVIVLLVITVLTTLGPTKEQLCTVAHGAFLPSDGLCIGAPAIQLEDKGKKIKWNGI